MLIIETNTDNATFGIYNMYGSLLRQQQLTGSINQTDIGSLVAGTYLIKVIAGNGQQKTELVIKK
jgi:hypothetical protein